MASYKSRKAKPRRTSRRHSTSGRILPPLDVRSKNSLGEFEKRIKKGPVTIIMVYADWCGHCHTMMPHFDAASASKDRSVQSIKLNETMMSDANAVIKKSINTNAKPISVNGFPSIIVVDNKGNEIAKPNPPKSTEVLTELMNKSGNLAVNAGLTSEPNSLEKVQNRMSLRKNNTMNIVNNTANQLVAPNTMNMANSYKGEERLLGSISSTIEPTAVEPSTLDADMEVIENLRNENKKESLIRGGTRSNKRGGSLLAALSQSSYTLAPTAALLASAAYIMKNKHKSHKSSKTRKTRKMHKKHH